MPVTDWGWLLWNLISGLMSDLWNHTAIHIRGRRICTFTYFPGDLHGHPGLGTTATGCSLSPKLTRKVNSGESEHRWVPFSFLFLINFLFCIRVEPIHNAVVTSGEQWRDSAIHLHGSTLPQTPLPSRLPQNIEQSSLCSSVGPCWLSILNIELLSSFWPQGLCMAVPSSSSSCACPALTHTFVLS